MTVYTLFNSDEFGQRICGVFEDAEAVILRLQHVLKYAGTDDTYQIECFDVATAEEERIRHANCDSYQAESRLKDKLYQEYLSNTAESK